MKKIKQSLIKFLAVNKPYILFIILMSIFRSAVADWYTVPTGSMLPTIEVGDRITVDKMAYDLRIPFTEISLSRTGEPERGDIIVFESQAAQNRLIKRVIGVPGDKVAMHNEVLIVNGVNSKYTFLTENETELIANENNSGFDHKVRFEKAIQSPLHSFGEVTVPKDHYLVLGDNRRNSADSRVYGFIPRNELKGKAKHIAFSLDYDNYYLPKAKRAFKSLY